MRGRGVGAVRRVRDEDGLAGIPLPGQRRADHEDAGELPLRAGRRLERDAGEARQLDERLLETPGQLERPLRNLLGRERVSRGKSGEPRDFLVGPRVVLHRARAQRIERLVDGEIQPREPREVARHFHLRDLSLSLDLAAPEPLGDREGRRYVERRQGVPDLPLSGALEDERLGARLRPQPVFEHGALLFQLDAQSRSLRAATRRSNSSRVFISVTATRNRFFSPP